MSSTADPSCLFLDGVFQVGGGRAPSGVYNPADNSRTVQLGTNHATPTAQMASLHETFHAFLNASTTFGAAMVFAGALAEAGFEAFEALVGRMVDDARTVHETYATLAAIYAAAGGRFDRSLLADYRLYHRYYDAVAAVTDLNNQPLLVSIVLDACANCAMQTDVLLRWAALPCEAWPQTVPSPEPSPDARFEVLMQPSHWSAATLALASELRRQGEPAVGLLEPALQPEAALARLRGLDGRAREALQRAAFAPFADALEAAGLGRCGFDDQRGQAASLVVTVEAFAGTRLKTAFHTPVDQAEDLEAVWTDHRRERLDLRPRPDRGLVSTLRGQDPDILEAFTHRQGQPYLQMVAMPAAKAAALYQLPDNSLHGVSEDAILTGLRCRNVDAEGDIMLLLAAADPDEIVQVLAERPGVGVRSVICASALSSPGWRETWLASLEGPLAVLMDTDPFHLLEQLASGPVRIGRLGLQSQTAGEPVRIDVLVLHGAAEPEAVYFTPCSGALMKAMMAFGQARGWPLEETDSHVKAFQDLLLYAASHTVREEHRFGFGFWED